MMKIFRTLVIVASLTSPLFGSLVLEAKRIIFLGDSITFGGAHITSAAAYLDLAHPDPERVILNMGLPSETVSGLSEEGHAGGKFPRPVLRERLTRVLDTTKPDLIFACYGINCGIYKEFSEERFEAYKKGVFELAAEAKRRGIPLIMMTPWPFDSQVNKSILESYNEVLARYSKFLREEKEGRWEVLDVHTPMTAELEARRRTEPGAAFTRDGIHPNEEGGWYASTMLLRYLGAKTGAKEFFENQPHGMEVHQEESRRMTILRDAYLNAAGHKRPGMAKGLPIAEAEKQAAEIGKKIAELTK